MTISLAALLPHPPILLPQIGAGRETAAQQTLDAYAAVERELHRNPPDRLLLISTHGIVTLRRFHLLTAPLTGDLEPFGAPHCRIEQPYDPTFADALLQAAQTHDQPLTPVTSWEPHDHSAIVPLTLLRNALADTPTTVLSISFRSTHDHHDLGYSLSEAVNSAPGRTAVIASGDGAHTLTTDSPHGFHPSAEPFQQAFDDALQRWNPESILSFDDDLRRQIDESVVSPTAVLTGLLHNQQVRPQLLSAEAPWGVAYTAALLHIEASC